MMCLIVWLFRLISEEYYMIAVMFWLLVDLILYVCWCDLHATLLRLHVPILFFIDEGHALDLSLLAHLSTKCSW